MSSPEIITAKNVTATQIRWLWPSFVPAGKLTLLDGDPDRGKSLVTIDLAARLSRGRPFPDGPSDGRVRRTLFLQAEDNLEDTLRPRLEAADADLDHIFVLSPANNRPLRLPRHTLRIEQLIRAQQIEMVVIDPFIAFLSPNVCVGNDQMIRRVLGPLTAIAARTGCTIVLVRHLNKRSSERALYRGGGSIGIIGSVRSGLLITEHWQDKEQRIVTVTKSNVERKPPALCYRIARNDAGRPVIEWTDVVELRADDALHPPPEAKPVPLTTLQVAEWLLDKLRNGPMRASEITQAAVAANISEKTLNRAKEIANVGSKLINVKGKPSHWEWKACKPMYEPLPQFGDADELLI